MIKANFEVPATLVDEHQQQPEFRAKALESISGSMVFVAGTPLYWDILDDQ